MNSSLASPTGGGRTRVIDSARQVQKFGHRVTILCFVRPEQWATPRYLLNGKKQLAMDAQCRVIYIPRFPFTRYKTVFLLNAWFCGFVIALVNLLLRIDIVHGHGVHLAYFGILGTSNFLRTKVVADVHGAVLEEALYAGRLPSSDPLVEVFDSIERRVLDDADWVIFVSKAMEVYYWEKYGLDINRISVIPSAINKTIDLQQSERQWYREALGVEGKIVFSYVGSDAPYQLVPQMCELFAEIQRNWPDAFFLVLSHRKKSFEDQLEKLGIDSNYLIKSVSHDEVFDYLQASDIGFLLRDHSFVNKVSSPTKFAEYCVCGVPVISTKTIGDISLHIIDENIGFLVDVDNLVVDDRMKNFVEDVMNNREVYIKACNSFVAKHFSWDVFGNVLDTIYKEVGS